MTEVTLSSAQLGALNNGTTVELGPGTDPGRITINPPCEKAGHDWGGYRVKDFMGDDKEDYRELTRSCSNCNETQKRTLDMSQVFEE